MPDAKVVSIIDEFRVVINRGKDDGVTMGDRYLIYNLGEEVKDPDTNEDLGRVEIIKGRGSVVHLQKRLATIQTTESYEIQHRPMGIAKLLNPLSYEVSKEPKKFIDAQPGDFARSIG